LNVYLIYLSISDKKRDKMTTTNTTTTITYILPKDLLQFVVEFLDIHDFYAIKIDMMWWLCAATYCRNVDMWDTGSIYARAHQALTSNRLDIVKYMHKTETFPAWAIDVACSQGNIELVYFLVSKGLRGTPESIFNAVEKNYLDIVRFLHYHIGITEIRNMVYAACKGFEEIVDFLYTVRSTEWDLSSVFKSAAETNHIGVVKFFVAKGERCNDPLLIDVICERGLFCMLEYLHDLGYRSPNRDIIISTYQGGHIGIVKYLYATGYYKIPPSIVDMVIREKDLNMIKFLYAIKPFYPNQVVCSYESGCPDITDFLYSMGHTPLPFTINTLCRMGYLYALEIIHKNGGKFYPASIDLACEYGHTDLVKFLISTAGCTPTEYAIDRASLNGHMEIVEFLYYNTKKMCTENAFNWSHANGRYDVSNFLVSVRPFLDIQPTPHGIIDIY
jgi:hypothetical protein